MGISKTKFGGYTLQVYKNILRYTNELDSRGDGSLFGNSNIEIYPT